MTAFGILIILVLLFFGMFVVTWRIRHESIRTRKVLEGILEVLSPNKPENGTKKPLEHYQHFFGDKK